ncbi:MAG: hypothetical protein ABR556_02345 [Pyrinomonadaceae bacterium]
MNDHLRALFPVTARANYLNHAAVSPPPLTTIEAIRSQLADVSENGSVNFHDWIGVKERTRHVLACIPGVRLEQIAQIAFLRNTSDGFLTVANGLDCLSRVGRREASLGNWNRAGESYSRLGSKSKTCNWNWYSPDPGRS